MIRRNLKLELGMILLIVFALSSCNDSQKLPVEDASEGGGAGLANPASVYCEGLGYELELRSDEAGSFGICMFPDGTECEEWDFLAGRCGQQHSYCAQEGYELLKGDSNIGTCNFPDGSSCGELDFFEGRCGPENE
jgi:putative hemolysin